MLRVYLKAHITFTFFTLVVAVSRYFLADKLVTHITIEQFSWGVVGGSGGGSEAGLGNKLIVGHCICKEPAFRVPRKKVSLVTNFVWFYRISWPS